MKYSKWVDRIWMAVGDYWLDLEPDRRPAGVACDTSLLERAGIAADQGTPEETARVIEAVYSALKGIEAIGQLFEVTPRHFRMIDLAPLRIGRSLIPLLGSYSNQPLEKDELAFLRQLVKQALSWPSALPLEGGETIPYALITGCDVADVFRELGWPWTGFFDTRPLEITGSLRASRLLETSYAGGILVCLPTSKGIVRAENARPERAT